MGDPNDKRTPDVDPDAPASDAELAASRRLRDALEDRSIADADADLARALAAAFAPSTLPADEHEAILADLPDAAELAAAERLREDFAQDPAVAALRAAWSPGDLPDDAHRALVAEALGSAPAGALVPFDRTARRARAARTAFGVVAGAVALAAGVLVWIDASSGSEIPLARARSTQPLFDEPFKPGDASARIDRIAMARATDFRDNRFARWGVR